MRTTPFQERVKCLDRSLNSDCDKIALWVIDNARPYLAVRQDNLVTVCFCCGNTMVYAGKERYVRCCNCHRTVQIVEEQDWLASKRMASRYFASLDVVEGIQLMRTYEVTLRYSAINRLKDACVREICRHWITSDGRCEVTSFRRLTGFLLPKSLSMKLRRGSTEIEDHIANHAFVMPDMKLLPELVGKLADKDKLLPGNALANIRNLLEPDYSTI